MNSTTKKFLSAIFATAIVFTQAGAAVSAATSSPWGTSTSQTTQSSSTKSSSKNYNNSSDYTDTDKYGNAFPYSYYYYSSQNSIYKKLYKYLAEAMRDGKSSLKFKGYGKTMSTDAFYTVINRLRYDCPDLYYVNHCSVEKNDNDIIVTFSYKLTKDEIKATQKKFAKYSADFDAYLSKNNATSTKDFFSCALAYIGQTVKYDKAAAGNHDKYPHCDDLYGAVIDGKVVCAGYARVLNYLCQTHGISYAYKIVEATAYDSHAVSCAIYNNTWYIFDPTAYKMKDLQMVSDATYVKLSKNYYKGSFYMKSKNSYVGIAPSCGSKETSSSSSSTSKVTSKSALLNNWNNRMSDEGYISRFEVILKNNFSAYASDYDTFTYTFSSKTDSYMEYCVKIAEKLKKAGTISYKSIEICTPETGERFILIYLK